MSKLTDELKKLDKTKLEARVVELRAQLAEQKRAQAAGELPNKMAVSHTRRAVAVGLTLLAQQEAAGVAQPQEEK